MSERHSRLPLGASFPPSRSSLAAEMRRRRRRPNRSAVEDRGLEWEGLEVRLIATGADPVP